MRFPVQLAGGLALAAIMPISTAFAQNPATPAPIPGPTTAAEAKPAVPATKPATAPPPYKIGDWTVNGSVRLRGENWNWFDTPGFDDNYTFGASLLRLGIGRQTKSADYQFELSQPTLLGLPDSAVAPPPQGQLGHGGTYRAVNGAQDGSIFLKQAFVKFKGLGSPANSLKLGRLEFWDGSEVMPKDGSLAWLKRERINHRLIGNFGFSHVQRSFDGVQFTHDTPKGNFTFLGARPTEGVFQLNGMGEVKSVHTFYGSYTKPMKSAEGRLFLLRYHDGRGLTPVDNRPAPVRAADTGDINVNTLGAHYIRTFDLAGGKADILAWGALQNGDWGSQSHRAHAVALEAGYQPAKMKWKPWLRVGYFNGSGDDTPEGALGGRHQTFFQVLPTPRIYARFPFYNLMNNEDLFAQAILRPNPKTTIRADAHRVRLSSAADSWYLGGGAFNDTVFGYQGRPSGGNKGLANIFDVSIERQLNPLTSVTLYAAHASGGGAVANVHPAGDSANYFYLELSRKF